MLKTDNLKPFTPGQSGNPGGKTTEIAWLREEARRLAARSLAALADVLETGSGSERVRAARELLDRGYGKSVQAVEASVTVSAADLSDADLARIVAQAAGVAALGDETKH